MGKRIEGGRKQTITKDEESYLPQAIGESFAFVSQSEQRWIAPLREELLLE